MNKSPGARSHPSPLHPVAGIGPESDARNSLGDAGRREVSLFGAHLDLTWNGVSVTVPPSPDFNQAQSCAVPAAFRAQERGGFFLGGPRRAFPAGCGADHRVNLVGAS